MATESVRTAQVKAFRTKLRNIIDMGVSFSAMGRVFEGGSTTRIQEKLYQCIDEILNLSTEHEYHRLHRNWCHWFTHNVRTAKSQTRASWGQAAKVLDIVLKVCIYYCQLPAPQASCRIVPWLNAAIDTAIVKDLRKRYRSARLSHVDTLGDISEDVYQELQAMVRQDVARLYQGEVFPVQYDDIRWRELNR